MMLEHVLEPTGLHHRVLLEVVLARAEELCVEQQLGPLLSTQPARGMNLGTLVCGQGHVGVVLLQPGHVIVETGQQALAHVNILRVLGRRRWRTKRLLFVTIVCWD